jgi:hypothetical protein
MSLQGSLSELPLPDVIQLVSVSGKTGAFEIQGRESAGKIFLRDGQIVDALVGRLRGDSAVYEMAIWSQGTFSFNPGEESEQVTIHMSNASLMMEAARRLDEWRVLSRKIPSLDLVPYFTSREQGADQVTLSPQEWILVTRIDGEQTIEEIASDLKWAPFDVSKLLFGMITTGLVALGNPGEAGDAGDAGQRWQVGPNPVTLLGLAEKIRAVALDVVGSGGERTIEKQYTSARTLIERGEGFNALREMVEQNTKAISLLKGSDTAAMFDEQVRPLLSEVQQTE